MDNEIKKYCEYCKFYSTLGCQSTLICKDGNRFLSAVKRGHWYHNTSKYISELDAYFIQACCSCCGRYSDKIDRYTCIMSNETCSHCGTVMDNNGNDNDMKEIQNIIEFKKRMKD